MPNWCYNRAKFTHTDPKKLDKLEKALEKAKKAEGGEHFFNALRKRPKEEQDSWYSWNIENWGCKWDAFPTDYERDENSITAYFDTPWGPPIALYEYLDSQDWGIEAYYHEPGMCFCGSFIDGIDDVYEYDDILDNYEELQKIPEGIYEFANLECEHENHMEWLKESEDEE